jgi:hypothetical protein
MGSGGLPSDPIVFSLNGVAVAHAVDDYLLSSTDCCPTLMSLDGATSIRPIRSG